MIGNSRAFYRKFVLFVIFLAQPIFAAEAPKADVKEVTSQHESSIEAERKKFSRTASPLDVKMARSQLEKFPRWRKNKKYRKAMLEEDKIWVVAKTRDSRHPKMKEELAIAGVGMTKASKSGAFQVLNDFPGWKTLDDYIREVSYDAAKNELYIHLAAYGYYAKMFMQVQREETDQYSDLYMKVIRGHFLGMTVGFRIQKDAKSRKSEILMTAVHPFETLPLPESFIEFGLEVVFQRLGLKLRQKMQSSFIASGE